MRSTLEQLSRQRASKRIPAPPDGAFFLAPTADANVVPAPGFRRSYAAVGHDHHLCEPTEIQPKLVVGQPADQNEDEADRIASDVVRNSHLPGRDAREARLTPVPEMRAAPDGQPATPLSHETEAAIQRMRGRGQPLSAGIREPMEGALGFDFGSVKIHTDPQADELNRAVNSRAFTIGSDIFFRQGAYAPRAEAGRELLAHELTHVVQQHFRGNDQAGGASAGRVQRAFVTLHTLASGSREEVVLEVPNSLLGVSLEKGLYYHFITHERGAAATGRGNLRDAFSYVAKTLDLQQLHITVSHNPQLPGLSFHVTATRKGRGSRYHYYGLEGTQFANTASDNKTDLGTDVSDLMDALAGLLIKKTLVGDKGEPATGGPQTSLKAVLAQLGVSSDQPAQPAQPEKKRKQPETPSPVDEKQALAILTLLTPLNLPEQLRESWPHIPPDKRAETIREQNIAVSGGEILVAVGRAKLKLARLPNRDELLEVLPQTTKSEAKAESLTTTKEMKNRTRVGDNYERAGAQRVGDDYKSDES